MAEWATTPGRMLCVDAPEFRLILDHAKCTIGTSTLFCSLHHFKPLVPTTPTVPNRLQPISLLCPILAGYWQPKRSSIQSHRPPLAPERRPCVPGLHHPINHTGRPIFVSMEHVREATPGEHAMLNKNAAGAESENDRGSDETIRLAQSEGCS